MSKQYNWSVVNLLIDQTKDKYVTDVVWKCVVFDGVNSAETIQYQNIQQLPSSTFIPFDQLTEEKVLEWVFESLTPLGLQGVYNTLDGMLAELTAPIIVSADLPWTPSSSTTN